MKRDKKVLGLNVNNKNLDGHTRIDISERCQTEIDILDCYWTNTGPPNPLQLLIRSPSQRNNHREFYRSLLSVLFSLLHTHSPILRHSHSITLFHAHPHTKTLTSIQRRPQYLLIKVKSIGLLETLLKRKFNAN